MRSWRPVETFRTFEPVTVDEHALDRLDLQRRGQVVEDRVQQRLHALVLERRATEDRRDLDRERRPAQGGLQHVGRHFLLGEVQLGDVVVEIGQRLQQVLARRGGRVGEVGRDVGDVLLLAEVVLVDDRLHA